MSRLYVGNVSSNGKMEELKGIFEDCGKVKLFDIKDGSGYVEYATPEEAEEAIKKCHNKTFGDKSLTVEPSRRPVRSRKMPTSKHSYNNSFHHNHKRYLYKSRSASSSSRSSRKRHSKHKHSHSSPKRSKHHHRHHSRHHSRSRSHS